MRSRALVPLLLLASRLSSGAVAVAAPAPAEWSTRLEGPVLVEGVVLPVGTALRFAADASAGREGPEPPRLVRAVPPVEVEVAGLPAAAGEELYLGPFVSLTLAREASVQGLPLETGSVVEFERRPGASGSDEVKVVRGGTLARATLVRGIQLPGGAALEFLPDGTLWRARLVDDEEVAGLPVSADEEVSFHPGGRIASVVLFEDREVDGRHCASAEPLMLFPSGRLERCTLVEETMLQGVTVSDAAPSAFFESGGLAEATLGATLLRDVHVLAEGTRVAFHPGGRLRRVRSALPPDAASPELAPEPQLVRGIPLTPFPARDDDGAWFRPDGTLDRVVTRAIFVFDGVPVDGAAGPVEFWPSGRLKSARVSRECVVRGRTYTVGARVRLSREPPAEGGVADSLRAAGNR